MKRLRISSLMDEYTDTEFFPTEGSAVNSEEVKDRVLADVKTQTKKKQMPRKKKLLLVAALAAAMVLLLGAGLPYIQHQLVSGSLIFGQDRSKGFVESVIMKEEDGRLFFTPKGEQRLDITDLVSEETPYIYDGSDPDTGLTYYIIMGGTPECYGWLTWIRMPNPIYDDDANEQEMTTAYHYYLMDSANGRLEHIRLHDAEWWDDMNHPWLLAGAEQLGITFLPAAEFEAMVEAETQ